MTSKINYMGREIELPSTKDHLEHMLGQTDCSPSKKNCFICNHWKGKNMTKRFYPDDLEWFGYET